MPTCTVAADHETDDAIESARHFKSRARSQRNAKFYRPELDAMRFFAFLCVFQHHVRFTLGLDRLFPSQIRQLQEAGG
jgi:peptidoglycan/LPS O-acetylase OafA/YrhL